MLKIKALLTAALITLVATYMAGTAGAATSVESQVCSSPPPVTITSPLDQSSTTDDPVVVEGQAESGAVANVIVNGDPVGSGTVPQSGVYTVPVHLPIGSNDIFVEVDDICGATVDSDTITVTRIWVPTPQPSQPPSGGITTILPIPKRPATNKSTNPATTKPPSPVTLTPNGSKEVPVTVPQVADESIHISKIVLAIAAIIAGLSLTYGIIAGKLSLSKIVAWFR